MDTKTANKHVKKIRCAAEIFNDVLGSAANDGVHVDLRIGHSLYNTVGVENPRIKLKDD
jgi:hypothetical protein